MGSFDAAQARLNANRPPEPEKGPILESAKWQPGKITAKEEEVWLWADIITGNSVNLVVAPGNTGKTRLSFELMAALARGNDDLYGHALDPGATVPPFYCMTTEMNEATTQSLAAMTGLGVESQEGFIPRCWWWDQVDGMLEAITAYRLLYPHGLVVLDSVTSLYNPDYTDSQDASNALDPLKRIGGTVILLHHESKDRHQSGADRVAGSAAWVHQSARLIQLKRLPNGGMSLKASRRGPTLDTVLSVDWDPPLADSDADEETGAGTKPRDRAVSWIQRNPDACTAAATVKEAWKLCVSEGLEVGYHTFIRAYQSVNIKEFSGENDPT